MTQLLKPSPQDQQLFQPDADKPSDMQPQSVALSNTCTPTHHFHRLASSTTTCVGRSSKNWKGHTRKKNERGRCVWYRVVCLLDRSEGALRVLCLLDRSSGLGQLFRCWL
eukprot:g7752.t1